MQKIKLQQLLQQHYQIDDFDNTDDSILGKVKLVIISTLKDRAYDFINVMMNETNKTFTQNLYPSITSSTFYDFDLIKEQNRFIIIFSLDTYADCEEVFEYFSELIVSIDQSFTDIIADYYDKNNLNQYHRIYTHDDKLNQSTVKITLAK